VLWTWFPGQDCGQALADVIFGTIEPSGRLPWTLPASEDDVPIPDAIPDAQLGLDYAEGREVGYRAWLRSERRPAAPFGHGLGWTEWEYLTASLDGQTVTSTDVGDVTVSVELRNVGDRAGREVVQVYLESTSADRPLRWLAGFATVDAAAGETVAARVSVPQRAREIWDVAAGGWTLPETAYRIVIGRSVTDRRLIVDLPASHRE
jgi:beta-glucosidase